MKLGILLGFFFGWMLSEFRAKKRCSPKIQHVLCNTTDTDYDIDEGTCPCAKCPKIDLVKYLEGEGYLYYGRVIPRYNKDLNYWWNISNRRYSFASKDINEWLKAAKLSQKRVGVDTMPLSLTEKIGAYNFSLSEYEDYCVH